MHTRDDRHVRPVCRSAHVDVGDLQGAAAEAADAEHVLGHAVTTRTPPTDATSPLSAADGEASPDMLIGSGPAPGQGGGAGRLKHGTGTYTSVVRR